MPRNKLHYTEAFKQKQKTKASKPDIWLVLNAFVYATHVPIMFSHDTAIIYSSEWSALPVLCSSLLNIHLSQQSLYPTTHRGGVKLTLFNNFFISKLLKKEANNFLFSIDQSLGNRIQNFYREYTNVGFSKFGEVGYSIKGLLKLDIQYSFWTHESQVGYVEWYHNVP